MGRLRRMEDERPTGISCAAAEEAAESGGTVAFEGRQARVVSLSHKSGVFDEPSSRLELDLGDEYLTLHGYCARDDEFVETRRERPF